MAMKVYPLRLPDELHKELFAAAKGNEKAMAALARKYIREGLERESSEKSADYIAKIVREQMAIVLKPSVERLAKLMSKTGHMASAATFLTVQAFMDLVPPENRKIPQDMYERAKKKAAAYMKMPVDEFNDNESI